jgi:pimeloyl-ACP methyl ester carboxylesterase
MAVDLAFSDTGSGPSLVVLHGLFGSRRNWTTVAGRLARSHRVLTVDLRNHGESPWGEPHDYDTLAEDVARFMHRHLDGPAAVLGHSMGGKAAMVLALSRPELVTRLVVVDIAPAPSRPDGPRDCLRAMRAVPLAACPRRSAVAEALATSLPAPIGAFLAQNAVAAADGLRWSVNLEALERSLPAISGFPDIPDGRRFTGPTLFVAGGNSDFIREEHRPRIDRLFPSATLAVIPDAGHWVHADAPEPFVDLVARWLSLP